MLEKIISVFLDIKIKGPMKVGLKLLKYTKKYFSMCHSPMAAYT